MCELALSESRFYYSVSGKGAMFPFSSCGPAEHRRTTRRAEAAQPPKKPVLDGGVSSKKATRPTLPTFYSVREEITVGSSANGYLNLRNYPSNISIGLGKLPKTSFALLVLSWVTPIPIASSRISKQNELRVSRTCFRCEGRMRAETLIMATTSSHYRPARIRLSLLRRNTVLIEVVMSCGTSRFPVARKSLNIPQGVVALSGQHKCVNKSRLQ